MKNTISLFLFLSLSVYTFAQMSGNYTIGSASSNFNSIQNAVDSLISSGINGPVVFELTDNSYQEQIRITEVSGASAVNTITFRPSPNKAVAWSYSSATANANYILKLDSADFIRIREINFSNPSLNYGRIVEIDGEASNNQFIQNEFIGQNINSFSDNYALIYSSGDRDTFNIFDSNTFTSGSVGVYLSGSGNPENFNRITNNGFSNQYASAVYCSNQEELQIEGNHIVSNSAASTYIGIEIESSFDQLIIVRNKVSFYSEGFCLLFDAINASPGNEVMIANNMLHAGGNTAAIGIFIETSNYMKVYNNNIHITSTSLGSAGRAINIQNVNGRTSHIDMRNNVIANLGLGFGIITFTNDSLSSDYNCFYTPNCPLGYWAGYSTNTLAIWWLYTNQDSNSIITNPGFFSPTDLHVTHKNLDSSGLVLADVIVDYDGDLRDSLYPDIGADEFHIYKLDAGLTQIVDPVAPCLGDSSMISVRVKNFGLDTIFRLSFNWYAQSVKQNASPIIQFIQIDPGQVVDVNLANYLFQNKETDIEVEIITTNSVTDDNSANNFITRKIKTALFGSYTIGMNGDYENIANAVSALHEFGVCGNVEFHIQAGIYPDQLSINDIKGASATNRIRFIGEKTSTDSVYIPFTAGQWYANYTLKNGSPWISFENLSIMNDGSTYGRVVDLVGGTHGVKFIKNNLIGVSTVNLSADFAVVYAGDNISSDSSMVFDSNNILNGSYGIYLSGLSLNDYSRNNTVSNNSFENQYMIAMQNIYQQGFQAIGNRILANSNYSAFAAIQMQNVFGDFVISRNKINVKKGRFGINITYSNGNVNSRGLISNNFIHVGGSNTNVKGIGLDMSSFTNIYNNSIHISNDQNSSSGLYINSNVSNTWIYNNNLVNTGLGYAVSYFGITNLKSNYNNFYTTSANFAWYNGNRSNLAAWQQATNYDSSSVSADPYFTSKTDLHARAMELDSAGTTLQKVLYDIDGDLRNPYFTDIGADEFILLSNDAGILSCPSFAETSCDGLVQLEVELGNFGIEKLDSVYIALSINGQIQDTITYKGPLYYLESDTVQMGNYSFSADSSYSLSIFTFLPNGKTDQNTKNDSFTLTDLRIINSPEVLSTTDTFICYNDSALLQASSANAFSYFWFDSIAGGKLLHIGQNYKTPKLPASKTYYVEARSKAVPDSLKTTYNSGLGNLTNGCMFDISAISTDISIDSFDIHTQYKKQYLVWVYYKKGSYSGYQNDSSSWTLIDTISVKALGYEKPSRVPLGGFTIPRGEIYSVYISTIPVSYMNFSSGTTIYLDDHVAIYPGIALDYLFDATFSVGSVFNGQVYYSSGSYCSTARKAATAFVKERPEVVLPNDTSICYQKTLELNADHGPSYHYEWRLLPSSTIISTLETFTVLSNGTYSVTVNDGCGNWDADTIQVINAFNPEADFIVNDSSQCIYKNNFIFTNKSFVLSDTLFFQWDFGNGDGSVDINPRYSYQKDSIFNVTLIATSDKGCVDSLSRNVYVNPKPRAAFATNIISDCLNDNEFDFYNETAIKYGLLSYHWNLGDGNNSTDDSIFNYSFPAADTFDVELIAKSGFACYDTLYSSVIVKENPEIDLGLDTTLCASQHIVLQPGFGYDEYLWSNDSSHAAILVDTNGFGIGSRRIWVKVTEEGCESFDTIQINFVICGSIGENDFYHMEVYPNPVSDLLYLKTSNIPSKAPLEISVLHVEGKQLLHDKILYNSANTIHQIDVSHLPAAVYLLRISGDNYNGYSKFIKK